MKSEWMLRACRAIASCALVVMPSLAQAQVPSGDYVVGPEDVLSVSVWLHGELDRTVTVQSDGSITFPPVGRIPAAGLTPTGLGDRIAERLSTYLRQTATVTVTVTQYMSRSVFVTGAVANPGRYGFETIPGLMDVLNRAGGAASSADLTRVQILRPEGQSRRVINVDVAAALRLGPGGVLPDLIPGDTIVIPAIAGGTLPPGTGVGVLGEVTRPGVYGVGDGQDLWAVLAAAGGITQRGDLARVRILRMQNDSQAVTTLDLKDVLKAGGTTPYLVGAGDVVFVERTGQSFWGRFGTGLNTFLTVSRDLLNIAVLIVILDNNTNTSTN